ncbi:MAG: hypothetical protein Q4E81_06940 [Succinatimonas sp.]|nr:hypothetical protein [Succinatimonas sp.]
MHKFKIGALIALIIFTLALVIGTAGIYIAGNIFDSRFESAIAKINQKFPQIKLKASIDSETFTQRKGQIFFSLDLPKNNKLALQTLDGACDYELNLGLFSATFDIKKAPHLGNFDSALAKLNLKAINYQGKAEASLFSLKAQGAFKLDAFNLPLADGLCQIGESSIYLRLLSPNSATTEFAFGGLACKSDLKYNQEDAYKLILKGLALKSNPQLKNGSLSVDTVSLAIKELQAEASTLYLIGFSPEERVNDPSVREGFSFNDASLNIALDAADVDKRQALAVDGFANLAFAFPVVRDNTRQELYKMDNLHFDINFNRANFVGLFKRLLKGKTPIPEFLAYISENPIFKVNALGYTHKGENLKGNGEIRVKINSSKIDPESLYARFEGEAGKQIVAEFTQNDYANALNMQVARRAIDFDGEKYHTVIELKQGNLTLNGMPATSSN